MGRFVAGIRALALALGAPGLFVVALLDSSFLTVPEIADVLVIWMVAQHEARMLLYVIAATLGSLAGSLMMYYLGRKGGQALVRKRFTTARVERSMKALQRHGMMAVLLAALLPPPAPFKMFVLLAGAAGIRASHFSSAIALGRGIRFLVLGILTVEYGDLAIGYLARHGRAASLVVVGVLGASLVAYFLGAKAGEPKHR